MIYIIHLMELENIKIYRITHVENIPHILQYGITHKNSQNANPNFVAIGDVSLIDTRSTRVVNIDNGDFANPNPPTITLGDFIPFYFGIRMPMLYVIQNGGNFVEKATQPKDIVYLACSLLDTINSKTTYYFSDGHATDNLTSFYDSRNIKNLPEIIHWDSIKAAYWGGQENLNIKREKQAEFLVADDLPPNWIVGFGCYNDTAKQKLIDTGVKAEKIKIITNAYY